MTDKSAADKIRRMTAGGAHAPTAREAREAAKHVRIRTRHDGGAMSPLVGGAHARSMGTVRPRK